MCLPDFSLDLLSLLFDVTHLSAVDEVLPPFVVVVCLDVLFGELAVEDEVWVASVRLGGSEKLGREARQPRLWPALNLPFAVEEVGNALVSLAASVVLLQYCLSLFATRLLGEALHLVLADGL